jgi:hypothetical protein
MSRKQAMKFLEFDKKNPHVWDLFVRFTFEAINKGYKNLSSDMVLHRIRWETSIATNELTEVDGRRIKICNNYTPYYARKFHLSFPEHKGFFRTKNVNKD